MTGYFKCKWIPTYPGIPEILQVFITNVCAWLYEMDDEYTTIRISEHNRNGWSYLWPWQNLRPVVCRQVDSKMNAVYNQTQHSYVNAPESLLVLIGGKQHFSKIWIVRPGDQIESLLQRILFRNRSLFKSSAKNGILNDHLVVRDTRMIYAANQMCSEAKSQDLASVVWPNHVPASWTSPLQGNGELHEKR